jgi:hypothetical protein
MFIDIFLAEAAGKISKALISKIPIHLMDSVTTKAIIMANTSSITRTDILVLLAKVGLTLMAFSLLMAMNQNTIVATNIISKYTISVDLILNISPTNRAEYLLKLPPKDKIAKPIAVEQLAKTEIKVSVATSRFLLI